MCACVCVCEEAEHAKEVWERLPHVSLGREVCVCVWRLSTLKRRYGRGSHMSAWGGRCVCVCV